MAAVMEQMSLVPRGFESVRSYVSVRPDVLLGEDPPGLHVRRAGLDISRDVRMTHGDVETERRLLQLELRWADARRPTWFPIFEGILTMTPAWAEGRPTTRIALAGRYLPPFGRLGDAVDRLVGRRFVVQSVQRFLEQLAERLERELPPEPVRTTAEPRTHRGGTP